MFLLRLCAQPARNPATLRASPERNPRTLFFCGVSLKDSKFLFPTFCLETKGGAKSSSRFNAQQSLNPKAASYESALCSTLNLDGLKDQDSYSCYATQRKALYSVRPSLKNKCR